ncbi:MAG: Trm112 family protein [Acidimicrobiia bacterium]
MPIPEVLLEILACIECGSSLDDRDDRLVCRDCGCAYPVRDGIPIMLTEEIIRPGGSDE